VVGNLAYTSGHLPTRPDGTVITGRVGVDMDQQTACLAARQAALAILASLRSELGSLDRIRRMVKLFGVVHGASEFHGQSAVLNGSSEVFAEVLGPEAGVGVRMAIGANSLPLGAVVEIEAVFEVDA
jgi:enamine deaminase RidA (YjgF/YER057c/UK114 family)